jgi:hypothetical protein
MCRFLNAGNGGGVHGLIRPAFEKRRSGQCRRCNRVVFDRGSTSFHFGCGPRLDVDSTLRGKPGRRKGSAPLLIEPPALWADRSL